MIGLGAVDIVVPGLLPVGCFPLYLTNYHTPDPEDYGPKTGCGRKYNALSWLHNAMLRKALDHLQRKYPSVSIRYADYYSQIIDFTLNPLKYGQSLSSFCSHTVSVMHGLLIMNSSRFPSNSLLISSPQDITFD